MAALPEKLEAAEAALEDLGLDYDHSREERTQLEAALAAAAEREAAKDELLRYALLATTRPHPIWLVENVLGQGEAWKKWCADVRSALSPTPTEPPK